MNLGDVQRYNVPYSCQACCRDPVVAAVSTVSDATSGTGAAASELLDAFVKIGVLNLNDIPPGVPSSDRQAFDLYLWNEPCPSVIYFHGGGYIMGTKDWYGPLIQAWVDHGFNVCNVDYRIGEATAPHALEDCLSAYDAAVAAFREHGCLDKGIVVAGDSAGGFSALVTGFTKTEPAPAAIISTYGVTDITCEAMRYWFNGGIATPACDRYSSDQLAKFSKRWSPVHLAREAAAALIETAAPVQRVVPKVLTAHGTADSVVPHEQATALHRVLGATRYVELPPAGRLLGGPLWWLGHLFHPFVKRFLAKPRLVAIDREDARHMLVSLPGRGHGFPNADYLVLFPMMAAFAKDAIRTVRESSASTTPSRTA